MLERNWLSLPAAQALLVLSLAGASAGCQNPPDNTGPTGGPVMGAMDTHCQGMTQTTSQSSCHPTLDMSGPPPDMAGSSASDYGDTLYNSEGNDDDCKYHVKFSSTAVRKGDKLTFTVNLSSLTTNQPVTGANIRLEAFLSDTHPAPNAGTSTSEPSAGNYTIGPAVLDASGQWTVRFHFFENCSDALPDTPHGHAAFYLNVP